MYFEATIGNKLYTLEFFLRNWNSVHLLQSIMLIFKNKKKLKKIFCIMHTPFS